MVAVISIAVGLLPQTSAWVFYQDDRQPSHSTMVGTLEIDLPEGRGLGTAVLVDHCGILTNFHAVFGPWYVTALRAPSRSFPGTFTLTEATLPDGTQPATRAIPVVWGEYHGPGRHLRVPHHDWAYLVLDRCLGLEYGHFLLRAFDPQDLEEEIRGFAALGYSTGRQMMDPACSVHVDRTRTSWLHDCALEAGDSGGPIIRRGTSTMVALGASVRTDPTEPQCPSGGVRQRGAPLAHWSVGCANVAVPLTRDVVERVGAAQTAVGVQRALIALGYDAGPLGAIDEPRATTAIRQVQQEMGWPVTGKPTYALRKILWLKILVS
ncbi:MAG: peptidoglycan-binding protein [Geminicoccaceae bacterium]